jgi:putative transposase
VAERLASRLAQKAAQLGAIVHVLNVMPDSVHLFVEPHPTRSPAHLAGLLKGYTSHALRREFTHPRHRLPALWSRRYDIGTVGHVSARTVRRHIAAQTSR